MSLESRIAMIVIIPVLFMMSGCVDTLKVGKELDNNVKIIQIKRDYKPREVIPENLLEDKGIYIQISDDKVKETKIKELKPEFSKMITLDIATKSLRDPIVLVSEECIFVAWDQRIEKYDLDGSQLWSVDLKEDTGKAVISNLIIAKEGCVFMTENDPSASNRNVKAQLGLIGIDGSLKWIRQDAVDYGSVYSKGIVLGDTIYVAGTIGIKSFETMEVDISGQFPNSLIVTSFDLDGNVLQSRAFGNIEDFDYLYDFTGSEEEGLFITGRTLGGSGTLVVGDNPPEFCHYILSLDLDLNSRWLRNLEADDSFEEGTMYLDRGNVYVAGTRNVIKDMAVVSQNGMVMQIDTDKGRIICKTMDYDLIGEVDLTPISNERQAFAWTNQDGGWISILEVGDKGTGIEAFPIDYKVDEIKSVDDYFVVVGTVIKSYIPQPAHSSSIWFDTCGVIGVYDNDGKEISFKVVDEYEGSIVPDWLYIVQKNG